MQKVGMGKQDVKDAIRSQVLTVFFLPLIVSGCHVAATFPMILRIISLLNMTNVPLYIICVLISFGAFAALYVIIYMLTSKSYYRIVSAKTI